MLQNYLHGPLAYSRSYRDIEKIMKERGFEVDHSTIQHWGISLKIFHQKKKRPGDRWRLDKTYIKVKGQWKYFYRAVDNQGNTIAFLLTAKRDKKAALQFLTIAIGRNGEPGLINIDKSDANMAAIKDYSDDHNKGIKIRRCKYLNNIAEQDHRHVKRQCRAMLGFKSFHSAQKTMAGSN